jgi:hypothetical protein
MAELPVLLPVAALAGAAVRFGEQRGKRIIRPSHLDGVADPLKSVADSADLREDDWRAPTPLRQPEIVS